MPSFQTSYFFKLLSCTDQGDVGALFILTRVAWPPQAGPAKHSTHGIWDLRNQGRYSQVHYCTLHIIALLHIASVHYWCTFRLFLARWEQKLRAKTSNCTTVRLRNAGNIYRCGWLHLYDGKMHVEKKCKMKGEGGGFKLIYSKSVHITLKN